MTNIIQKNFLVRINARTYKANLSIRNRRRCKKCCFKDQTIGERYTQMSPTNTNIKFQILNALIKPAKMKRGNERKEVRTDDAG